MARSPKLYLDAVDAEATVSAVQGALRINSVFGSEGDVGDYLADLMKESGFDEVELREVEPGRNNVVGRIRGSGGGSSLVLQGHMDTVPPGNHPEPFSGAVRDGRIWGRGASDMKGPLVAAILAAGLTRQVDETSAGDCIVAATVDEESEKRGMFDLVDRGLNADFGINVEPTDLRIAIAQKGCVSLRVSTKGVAAHGANPGLGENAIYKMARAVTAIEATELPKTAVPRVGEVAGTYNVGVIAGGEMFFIVPDRCSIWVDRRTLPGETQEDAHRGLTKLLESAGVEAEVELDRQDWRWDRIRERGIGSSAIDPESPVVRAVHAGTLEILEHEPQYHLQTAWCETDFLSNDLGIPTVNFGPGRMELAHTSEEHIEVESLVKGVAILAYAVAEVCGDVGDS